MKTYLNKKQNIVRDGTTRAKMIKLSRKIHSFQFSLCLWKKERTVEMGQKDFGKVGCQSKNRSYDNDYLREVISRL